MIKKTALLFFLWCSASIGAQTVQFQIYDAAADLNRYLEETQDLSASFEQWAYKKGGAEVSSGQFKIKKPKRFFWDYQKPHVQKVVHNGEKVYFYDQDLAQVTVYAPEDLTGNLLAEILNDNQDLKQKFEVTLAPKPPAEWSMIPLNKAQIYRLIPKQEQEYDAIWLALEQGQLRAVLLDGAQKTVLAFKNVKRNQGLSLNEFQFKIPQGVDVLGE